MTIEILMKIQKGRAQCYVEIVVEWDRNWTEMGFNLCPIHVRLSLENTYKS